ncbi:MAG: amino acid adenylation domain-containing protein [Desulfuromonadales bacterium]
MISKANVKNIYPLTPLQEGILFHALYDAGASYFEQLSYRVKGNLDIPLFQKAWEELVRRHDVLRTVFVHKDVPRPLQIVLKQWRVDFSAVDLRGMTRDEAEVRIGSLKEQDRAASFNLARDPLTRVAVVPLADDETEVIWSHHHIILDGWSVGILQGELLEIYTALVQGNQHTLPEPSPFSGYVTWIGKQDQEASRRFWRQYLEGFSQSTGIPRFPLSEASQAGRGNLVFRIDQRRAESLAALAAENGVTLNVLLQTVWGILLCRINGVDEAVFAATVSGRPDDLKGIEGMVGLFINAVPVRIRIDGETAVPGLLKRVQADTLAASRHHWCSLADIQAETSLKQALLDHVLIFENYPLDERITDVDQPYGRDFSITRAEMRENTNYPFELSIIPGKEIVFRMGYDPAVYGHDQIERVSWGLEQLIDSLLENLNVPSAGLSILSPREKDLILTVFNKPHGDEAAETVADLFEHQAAVFPDRIALVFESRQFSCRDLNEAANRVANHLLERCGVQSDEVVAILMDRSERMMAGLLGIIKSGAAYLPLDPAFPAARIAYMLEDSRCRVLLTEKKHRDGLSGISNDAVIIDLDQLPDAPKTNPARTTRPDNLLYLMYTSGSTGLPKGVMLEQRNVISFNRNMAAIYGLAPGDTILALTTITFDISVLELICSLMSGMTVVLASDATANNPGKAAALLGRDGVNVLQITPSRLKLMLEETDLAALSGLKALLVGGEPLPENLFERLKGLTDTALFNVYGPTEATIWSTTARLNNARLTIGTPLVDEDVLILTPDGRYLLPAGVWGELCIGGQGLARGYWNRSEQTADRFIPHPVRPGERIYRTGDLGRFLPDGTLQCGGRMDNQVKVRGYRIETGEIEQTLLKIPGIGEAVAHIVEIDGLNEIAAYLVPDGNPVPSPSELRAMLAKTLPDYMLPSFYLILDKVPLTPNGKTDRKALPLPKTGTAGAEPAGGRLFVPPRTATEASVAAIWQRILGVEQVGMHDNFFDLGGHSIKAIRISSAIARELGQEIPLALIFQNPTPETLASALGGGTAAEPELVPLAIQPWYDVSPGQRRLWMLQQMAPGSSAYNMPVALKMEGVVDLTALRKSFAGLALRHEALRTVFPEQDGLPVQVILPETLDFLSVIDLCDQPEPWKEALCQARKHAVIPFDLAAGPLSRAYCYQTGLNEGLLLVVMHHIIGDGWSWGILLHDLARLYRISSEGMSATTVPLPVQYKEWAHHQNKRLAAGAWEKMRQYWHTALSDPAVPLDLPTDIPRPALRRDGGETVAVPIPAATAARLGELARSQNATIFMVLLSLLKTLLHRLGGQQQITVGVPVAGRPLQQIEEVAGFFVNTLALRSRITPDEPFTGLLTRVRRIALDGYDHQLYPFDTLVGELALPRDTGHAPLFDVMMVLQEEIEDVPGFHNMQVSPVPLDGGTSRFDLTFNFFPDGDALILELEYATDLFFPETANRIAQRFVKLAGSVAAAPHMPLNRLELLPEEERAALQVCATGAVLPWPEEKSMVDLFQDQAARFPDAVAVVAADQSISYAQLDRLSDRCALALQNFHTLRPEEAVGVMTGRSSSLPVALIGIMKAGGVYLPIDPEQPESRIRHIISDSGLRYIVVDEEAAAQVSVYADSVKLITIASLMETATAGTLQNRPAASSAAYIIYTSGSTGLPKGVLLQHGGFVNMILDQIRTFGITPADRCLLFSSFSFDGAMSEIFLALHSGAELVISRRDQNADPALFSSLLDGTGTTVATLPPVYLNALRTTGASLDPLRIIITAGEAAIAADVVYYARQKKVFNAYGPTEASVCSAIHAVDPFRPYHGSIPIGAPMANSELLILDEQQQIVPFGVTGEICVAGPGVARGYLNNPELTASVFVAHPFKNGRRLYRTGDLGRRSVDGTVQFLGRRDNQVKVRGFRIECGDVERALLKHPDVSGAVVVARGEGADRELVAFLLMRGELDLRGLKAELAKQLPSFMLPARFVPLEAFPLNINGKVDRTRLVATDIDRVLTAGSGEHPSTPMEKSLAAIWEQILGRTAVSRHDSFFEIGGQSIAAIRVVAAIQRQLNIQLPLPALFQNAILSELALECERTAAFAGGYQDNLHTLLKQGGNVHVFAFPPINGYPIAYNRLASLLDDVTFHGFTFIESDDRLKSYTEIIEQLQPDGPLIVMGHSSGGNLAFEMAKELESHGRFVSKLILLDSWKRLPNAPVIDNMEKWAGDYSPDPALYGNLAELMESPHIREVAFGKMRRYLDFIESGPTKGLIKGAIHLVRAGNSMDLEGLSQEWYDLTAADCTVHDGYGPHLDMLKEPWVIENARIVNSLIRKKP